MDNESHEDYMAHPTFAQRVQLARQHVAAHTVQLGIARWTSGNSPVQMALASSLMPADQANWHAKAQKDFLAWLENGGFACEAAALQLVERSPLQENASPNTEATALPAAAPFVHSGQAARNCNSLVIRIHDAVE